MKLIAQRSRAEAESWYQTKVRRMAEAGCGLGLHPDLPLGEVHWAPGLLGGPRHIQPTHPAVRVGPGASYPGGPGMI